MFCGRAGHLDEFCFRRKRIERRCVEYARDSYRDEFFDVPARSYSHVPPHFYSRASPHTFSRALPRTSSGAVPHFVHGPNHRSYGFGPRENRFEPTCFGYGQRPHRGDRFPRRSGFSTGGSFESDLVCALCHHGKMIAASHSPVNTVMTEHPGQLLHMDTVGPSRVRSMGGKWYVLVIVDDYSRYSWVFFLESKDQVFEHFQLLALRLNNEHLNWLKAIRSDNETEFRNASFDGFCLEHDIEQQFSAPRIPQQNGVVERKNRTLVEMARMMLDEYGTPRRFWTDAISTACYVSNRIFLRSILLLTTFEL
jgi:hypothetical protein